MAKVASNSPAAQRRAAQRRLSRELREGTYQRSRAGRSYEAARRRQRSGRDLGSTTSIKGHEWAQRRFTSIRDAAEWARDNLPPRTDVYLVGFGRLHVLSGDPDDLGKMVYRAVSAKYQAVSIVTFIPEIEARVAELFTEVKFFILRWLA